MRTDSRADLQAEGINYALISSDKFYKIFNESIDEWLQRTGGTVVKTVPMDLRAREPERDWYVVRFDFATPTPIVSTNHETVTTATAASR
jgi:hypothetical protein